MEKYMEVIEKVNCLLHKNNEMDKQSRDFGTGHLLYQSEIHTIEAIGNHEAINASELAQVLGITNGAVTQVTSKLVDKGLVEKFKKHSNKKEVYFRLTEQGEMAKQGHERFHKKMYRNMTEYLDTLDKNQIDMLMQFFDKLNGHFPQA